MKSQTAELSIRYQPIRNLKHNPRNSRAHSPRQIRQIADSIGAFGFNNPVLVDKDNTIIAGHGRVAAAKLLGMTEVPTIRLDSLSTDQIRAYVITDNRLAEKAGWDKSILAIELQHLLNVESEFEITVTGFEILKLTCILPVEETEPEAEDLFVKSTNLAIGANLPTWETLGTWQTSDSVRKRP